MSLIKRCFISFCFVLKGACVSLGLLKSKNQERIKRTSNLLREIPMKEHGEGASLQEVMDRDAGLT